MGLLSITASYIFFTVVHVVCLALALAVCALYGQDLHKADQKGVYADSRWVRANLARREVEISCLPFAA